MKTIMRPVFIKGIENTLTYLVRRQKELEEQGGNYTTIARIEAARHCLMNEIEHLRKEVDTK